VIPATVAGVGRAAGHAVMLALDVAFLTLGEAIRPALPSYVFEAGIIIWKFAVEIGQRVEQIFRNPLFGLAFRLILRDRGHCFTCIQGIAF